jgi:diacylglycerol kinase (ATP)
MRRALVIVNPIAGRGAGKRHLGDIERGLRRRGLSTQVAVTSQRGDARQAAADLAGDHDLVVVIGGDGTLNEVINGLEADPPVALYPLGTGNVLAKELRLPRKIARFCEMVERGRDRALDLSVAEGRRFISMAGAGFDAEVTATLAAARRGAIRMGRYVGPILRCLADYRFPRIAVSLDGGEPVEARGFVLVSNVRAYGGPFVIAADAVCDDGLLDVCVLRRGTRRHYVRAMVGFLLRCQRTLSGARYFRGRSIRLTSEERVRYQVDGDAAGFLPATFELLERKLRFIVP